jgi:hypothetical protein
MTSLKTARQIKTAAEAEIGVDGFGEPQSGIRNSNVGSRLGRTDSARGRLKEGQFGSKSSNTRKI